MKPKLAWHLGAAMLLVALALAVWQGAGVRAADPTPTPDPHHPTAPAATPAVPAGTGEAGPAPQPGATPAAGAPCAAPVSIGTSGAGMGDQSMMSGTPMASAGMGTPGADMMGGFDLMFVDMMIPHHESAVAMAQVALTRADHPEIKRLAQDIIASQGAEIDQLKAWRQAWYPDAVMMPMDQMMGMMGEMMQQVHGSGDMMDMPAMMGMAMDRAGAVATLCAAPAPFDRAFIDAMIPHHQSAIAMAQVAKERATHPELARLAQQIIDAQQREIGQMQEWRAAWYGATPTP